MIVKLDISEKNMFKIGYTSTLSKNIKTNKGWTSFFKRMVKNKILIISVTIFLIAICCNIILIYNFFNILEKIN